jgi:hypothetical protein
VEDKVKVAIAVLPGALPVPASRSHARSITLVELQPNQVTLRWVRWLPEEISRCHQ